MRALLPTRTIGRTLAYNEACRIVLGRTFRVERNDDILFLNMPDIAIVATDTA